MNHFLFGLFSTSSCVERHPTILTDLASERAVMSPSMTEMAGLECNDEQRLVE